MPEAKTSIIKSGGVNHNIKKRDKKCVFGFMIVSKDEES